jgi:hypothetical protein
MTGSFTLFSYILVGIFLVIISLIFTETEFRGNG